jgi:hypothetical protein
MLDSMYVYVAMSVSTALYPNLDLWTANNLQLQLQSIVFVGKLKQEATWKTSFLSNSQLLIKDLAP